MHNSDLQAIVAGQAKRLPEKEAFHIQRPLAVNGLWASLAIF